MTTISRWNFNRLYGKPGYKKRHSHYYWQELKSSHPHL